MRHSFCAAYRVLFFAAEKMFDTPYATIIESEDGRLLSARIAADGQWRFPMRDSVPYKFEKCITQFEDAHFYYHFGFNPVSIYRAFKQNIKAKKNVRGGSTLTQQVIRIFRKNKTRNYTEKIVELILATRLEFRHSKKEILQLYAAHAPFGGNVVGLEMASWRYFGVPSSQLSWAEAATLAVLPNSPALIYPGKNQTTLVQKRNRLLKKLFDKKIIDKTTYQSAMIEPPTTKPYALPNEAPHL
ncbi:MAG TPA: transglycosylase domain-containing protein, partial [Chitinophagales bacterium]